jgi:excisionase family DNA binding protein
MPDLTLSLPDELVETIAMRTAALIAEHQLLTDPPEPDHRIALSQQEAAETLGMSVDTFREYVQPNLRVVRCGRLRTYPRSELETWVDENAIRTLREVA